MWKTLAKSWSGRGIRTLDPNLGKTARSRQRVGLGLEILPSAVVGRSLCPVSVRLSRGVNVVPGGGDVGKACPPASISRSQAGRGRRSPP